MTPTKSSSPSCSVSSAVVVSGEGVQGCVDSKLDVPSQSSKPHYFLRWDDAEPPTRSPPHVPLSPLLLLLLFQVKVFRAVLIGGGKVCTIRLSKGDDEMAACGQLGDQGLSTRPAPMLKPPQRLQAALA